MGLSAFYGPAKSDEEAFALLDRAIELGCTFWDTSDLYGGSEDMLKRYFEKTGNRDKIFLATKFGFAGFDENRVPTIRGDPEYVHQACERSLQRLGVSHIDLYYQHRVDLSVPIEVTVKAMAELVKAGKVRHIGLSECSAATLRRAHAVHPIAAVQVEYSPFAMDIEYPTVKLLDTCKELGVALVAYSPLGRGMLTGKYHSRDQFDPDDFRLLSPRFSAENFHKNLELVHTLGEIASKKKVTPGQLTLAWLLAQGEEIIPIPGTTRIAALEENLDALHVKLSDEENAEIRASIEAAEVAGGRYAESIMNIMLADAPPLQG